MVPLKSQTNLGDKHLRAAHCNLAMLLKERKKVLEQFHISAPELQLELSCNDELEWDLGISLAVLFGDASHGVHELAGKDMDEELVKYSPHLDLKSLVCSLSVASLLHCSHQNRPYLVCRMRSHNWIQRYRPHLIAQKSVAWSDDYLSLWHCFYVSTP